MVSNVKCFISRSWGDSLNWSCIFQLDGLTARIVLLGIMGETGILEIPTAFHLSANILGCQAPPLEIKSLENPCPDSQQKGQTLLISQSPFHFFKLCTMVSLGKPITIHISTNRMNGEHVHEDSFLIIQFIKCR